MFTGIIQDCGKIVSVKPAREGLSLVISHDLGPISLGESVAVNGVCLTQTQDGAIDFHCDLSPETIRVTNFAEVTEGLSVNLEKPLTMATPIGGHFVMGHVDEVLTLSRMEKLEDYTMVEFSAVSKPEWLIEKGSITIDGISLTINKVSTHSLCCMIIPHTLANTNLNHRCVGDKVNVEYDYLAKIVSRQQRLSTDVCVA